MKKDTSRITVERALSLIEKIRVEYKKKIPYGPTKVYLSPAELRRVHDRMGQSERKQIADVMGQEKYFNMLAEVYGYGRD